MNEEPKSIWKKSWTGLHWLRAWLAVVGTTFFTVLIVTLFIPGRPRHFSDWWPTLVFILVASVAAATLFVGLWGFIRWLFCWRNLKRLLFGAACLATLIALCYAEEDWRGWHAWNQFKHEWEAKGERFDRASVVPPPVPEEQNFALTPLVASSYEMLLDKNGHFLWPRHTNVVNRLQMSPYGDSSLLALPTNGTGNWRTAKTGNLTVWQQYYRALASKTNQFPVAPQPQSSAADVLLALGNYDSPIEELRQGSKLPYSRFPLEYDKDDPAAMVLPHLAAMKGCAQVLQLRALAELQNGQTDQAIADIKLILRLVDSIRTEPILISHLVRIAMVNIALQPVWEGLAGHRWSDTQLAELDQELARLDFLSDYKLAMRGEMVLFQGGVFDYLRHHPEQLPNLYGLGDPAPPAPVLTLSRLIPSGWFYQNQLHCARPMVELYLPAADANQGIISPAAIHRADAAIAADTKHRNPYNMIESTVVAGAGQRRAKNLLMDKLPWIWRGWPLRWSVIVSRMASIPNRSTRCRRSSSTQLPHDIINGQPLHYRRDAETDISFSIPSAGMKRMMAEGLLLKKTARWT